MTRQARTLAVLELTLAGALWGFGFIAAVWALRGMGPLAVTGWRFALAVAAGFIFAAFNKKFRADLNGKTFWLAAIPGLLISATLVLQTYGLRYTTATKSGFITTLYVLIVPVLEMVFFKRRLPRYHFVYVLLALLGVALICDIPGALTGAITGENARLNTGDFLTFLCAIAASAHILWFEVIKSKLPSAFAFNHFQSIWAGALPLGLSFVLEPWPAPKLADLSLIGLAMLGFGSTLIAFALQVRAQKVIAPSLASLLFLLESPFATLFAIFLLGETLRTAQWAGAGLILIAAAMSILFTKESEEIFPSLTEEKNQAG